MLEILRQFGRQRLVGDPEAPSGRHLAWVADLAAIAGAHDHREVDAFTRLRAERANLWGALEHCLEDPAAAATGVVICRDLFEYWLTDGDFSRLLGALESFVEMLPGETRARADALWVSSIIRSSLEADRALAEATEAIKLGRVAATSSPWPTGSPPRGGELGRGPTGRGDSRADEAMTLGDDGTRFRRPGGDGCQGDRAGVRGRSRGRDRDRLETIALSERLGEKAVAPTRFIPRSLPCAVATSTRRSASRALVSRSGRSLETASDRPPRRGSRFRGRSGRGSRACHDLARRRGRDLARGIGQGVPPLLADQEGAKAASRAALGDARFAEAFEGGQGMSREEVIAYALGFEAKPMRVPVAASRAPGGLSRRELEVAQLMADGATNADAAAQLFISERTVESHVTNIFNKLGVDSRVQVVRWVTSLDGAEA